METFFAYLIYLKINSILIIVVRNARKLFRSIIGHISMFSKQYERINIPIEKH
jgi:hypothetical protein